MKRTMTIAGSDSGGGAGIQADLKTFSAMGTFGTSVITAITAQNTLGVTDVYGLPAKIVESQIDAVMSDIGTDAAKTGMLFSAEIIEAVANKVKKWEIENLVVDPVMVAKSGDRLLKEDAIEAMRRKLIPLALVITPNIPEAEVLTDVSIKSEEDRRIAARVLHSMGARYVIVKGGHLEGDPVDLLFDGQRFHEFRGERIHTNNTHGTGCTFSSAIAAQIARGRSVYEAVSIAKRYVSEAIRQAPHIGAGHGPLQHFPKWDADLD